MLLLGPFWNRLAPFMELPWKSASACNRPKRSNDNLDPVLVGLAILAVRSLAKQGKVAEVPGVHAQHAQKLQLQHILLIVWQRHQDVDGAGQVDVHVQRRMPEQDRFLLKVAQISLALERLRDPVAASGKRRLDDLRAKLGASAVLVGPHGVTRPRNK